LPCFSTIATASCGTHPHELRHQGITRALDLVGGDVRRVQRFSRQANLETLLRYDDHRRDEAGAIAQLLSEDSACDFISTSSQA
jgi:integrase